MLYFIDVDECAERMHNCGPQSVCNNNQGGFSCTCRPGFTGNPPAVRCQKNKSSKYHFNTFKKEKK